MRLDLLRQFNRLVEKETKKPADLDKEVPVSGEQKVVLSKGLKIKHKDSGLLYTIDSVSPDDVILKTPEGKLIIVDTDTLEAEYALS